MARVVGYRESTPIPELRPTSRRVKYGPFGILFDGANLWVTDCQYAEKLDSNGAVIQNVGVGASLPVFDGSNIWVPNRY